MSPHELMSYAFLFFLTILLLRTTFHYFTKGSSNGQAKLPPSPLALPVIGHLHLLGPLIHQALHKLSSRHGPLMYLRLGSVHTVVASDPDMAKEFLKTHDHTFAHRTHTQVIEYLTYEAAVPLGPYGPVWIFIKKISISELLGSHTLHRYLSIRTKELHCFIRRIIDLSRVGESVNITTEALRFSNNIISQMIMSYKCIDQDGTREMELLKLVREVTEAFGEFNLSDFLSVFKNVDLMGSKRRAKDIRRRYDAFLETYVREREKERKSGKRGDGRAKDFLDLLLDASEDENSEVQLRRDHVKGLLMDYLTAGTDSTAVGIEWAMAEIINNPRILNKARQEILQVVGTKRLVEETDIPNLPYIQAIIKETLRLHPPIPVILRGSMEECNVRGYTLPKDTMLIVNVWAIGRDPEVWKQPLEFLPERFLNTSEDDLGGSQVDVKGQHFQLLPFGAGRRFCSGTALAMQIIPVALAAMLQCFDWKVANGAAVVDMAEKPGITTPPARDIVCVPATRFVPPNLD